MFFSIKNQTTPLRAHSKKTKETISRLRSGVCSHSFINKKGSAARNWVGFSSNLLGFFFFWNSSVQTFKSFSISLVIFSSVFFLFIYKKSTCRHGNKQPVSQVGGNGSEQSVLRTEERLVDQDRETKAVQQIWVSLGGGRGAHHIFFFTWLGYSEELQQVQPSKVMMMMIIMMAGPSLLPVRAWTAPHSRERSVRPRLPQVSDSWPASGMTNTVMSSPEPSLSLGNLQPRSFSTPRDLISRSCAASVYLHHMHKHHLWQSAVFIDPIMKNMEWIQTWLSELGTSG